MPGDYSNEPMLDMFIFETAQNVEELEALILDTEKSKCYAPDAINKIFRIMHTIKGSSAMMLFNDISTLAHAIEDLFYYLRENKPQTVDCSALSDLVLSAVDFVKVELVKIKNGDHPDGEASALIGSIEEFLIVLKGQNHSQAEIIKPDSAKKQHYYIAPVKPNTSQQNDPSHQINAFRATVFFEDGCEMENIRAYTIIHNLREFAAEIFYVPDDIIDSDDSVQLIRESGFRVYVRTDRTYQEMYDILNQTLFLKDLELVLLENDKELKQFGKKQPDSSIAGKNQVKSPQPRDSGSKDIDSREQPDIHTAAQNIISVNVAKLDKLMDLMGEIVIAEAMVTQNPDLNGLELDNFQKASRQLHKITNELQDIVMSIRMVPLAGTFHKMQRIVRDMGKKLCKEVRLVLSGEETEVDKNIIEHISDPLMHLVRNAIDHGIEAGEDREAAGKPPEGTIGIEAKNIGSEVVIYIKDDGRGLNKQKILERAEVNGLLTKPIQELTQKEIHNMIFIPGFSTKEAVSEFSGRGVGMDVVVKNIEAVGGSVSVDSTEGSGSVFTLKIPLTLAIIDGMNIRVGNSCYTIPTTAIKESFRPKAGDIITDPDGNEMIMVRGQCYPILRLHRLFGVKTGITDPAEGILVMVEQDDRTGCILADALVGQQQVVVKAHPAYIRNKRKIKGLSGCTLLGDGSISLIIDVTGLNEMCRYDG